MNACANSPGPCVLATLGRANAVNADRASFEERAFALLEKLTPRQARTAQATFETWLGDLERRLGRCELVTALDHVALLHCLRSGIFAREPALQPYQHRIREALVASYEALTGERVSSADVENRRLPRRVLAAQSRDAQLLHGAVFSPQLENLAQALVRCVRDYYPREQDPFIAAGVLALLFSGVGQQIVLGALFGQMEGSLFERAIHKFEGHATPEHMKMWRAIGARLGELGKWMTASVEWVRFSHSNVHHGAFVGSYLEQFAPRDAGKLTAEEKESAKAERRTRIFEQIELAGPDAVVRAERNELGVTLEIPWRSAFAHLPVAALAGGALAAVGSLFGLSSGAPFLLSFCAVASSFVFSSAVLHRYMHMTRVEAKAVAAERREPLVVRQLLNTRLFAALTRYHDGHHLNPRSNYNLVPFADALFGEYRPAQVGQIVALRQGGGHY